MNLPSTLHVASAGLSSAADCSLNGDECTGNCEPTATDAVIEGSNNSTSWGQRRLNITPSSQISSPAYEIRSDNHAEYAKYSLLTALARLVKVPLCSLWHVCVGGAAERSALNLQERCGIFRRHSTSNTSRWLWGVGASLLLQSYKPQNRTIILCFITHGLLMFL